ncbi:unnamed protein product, partial [Prorocentrum cordatum]
AEGARPPATPRGAPRGRAARRFQRPARRAARLLGGAAQRARVHERGGERHDPAPACPEWRRDEASLERGGPPRVRVLPPAVRSARGGRRAVLPLRGGLRLLAAAGLGDHQGPVRPVLFRQPPDWGGDVVPPAGAAAAGAGRRLPDVRALGGGGQGPRRGHTAPDVAGGGPVGAGALEAGRGLRGRAVLPAPDVQGGLLHGSGRGRPATAVHQERGPEDGPAEHGPSPAGPLAPWAG